MPRFSEAFRLEKDQAELDFVDVELNKDIKLYICPYAIQIRDDAWSSECADNIRSFFNEVLDQLRRRNTHQVEHLLGNLHEPNETRLGESRGEPDGRGIGPEKAAWLAGALRNSRAFETGVLSDVSEAELFIKYIGRDTISDLSTNIIRGCLARYTVDQCKIHNIQTETVASLGPVWIIERRDWVAAEFQLPIYENRPVLLVPKFSVRKGLTLNSQEFYNFHMVEFLQAEYLTSSGALVQTLRNGTRRVTKKSVKERHPFIKDDLATFVRDHPEVLQSYKEIKGAQGPLSNKEIDIELDEPAFSQVLVDRLMDIPSGGEDASLYHSLCFGICTFLFHPHLITPVKEFEQHEGRKRVDIKFTNTAELGFFNRMLQAPQTRAISVFMECKNYTREVANPEFDQLSGRFGHQRGFFGMLLCRNIENRDRIVAGCRDTASDGRGYMIALQDSDLIELLGFVRDGQRGRIDNFLQDRFDEISN